MLVMADGNTTYSIQLGNVDGFSRREGFAYVGQVPVKQQSFALKRYDFSWHCCNTHVPADVTGTP